MLFSFGVVIEGKKTVAKQVASYWYNPRNISVLDACWTNVLSLVACLQKSVAFYFLENRMWNLPLNSCYLLFFLFFVSLLLLDDTQ